MASIHKGLTITVTIAEKDLDSVAALLEDYNRSIPNERDLYHKKLSRTFFISWLTISAELYADKEKLPARIILLTSYVGNKCAHIKELVSFLSDKLIRVFSYSPEFPLKSPDEESLCLFLKKQSVANTFYSGFKFIDPGEVNKEKELKDAVFEFLDTQPDKVALKSSSPDSVKKMIEGFVSSHPSYRWAVGGIKGLPQKRIYMLLPLIILGLVLVSSLLSLIFCFFYNSLFLKIWAIPFLAFIAGLLILFLFLRLNEMNPHISGAPLPDAAIKKIVAREKNQVVNEMTVITPLKKGLIRRIFLAVSLRLVSLVRYFSYIPTVHTARWLQIDQGKRLVFIANFDNISEAYAHDFVDSKARSRNLAIIFSHTFGFPPTTWLVHHGENYRKEYMKGVRAFQKVTRFWYARNTTLSVENLKRNRQFREGLFKNMDEEEIRNWLLTI